MHQLLLPSIMKDVSIHTSVYIRTQTHLNQINQHGYVYVFCYLLRMKVDDDDEEAARERRRRARQERLRNMENEELSNTAKELNSTDR